MVLVLLLCAPRSLFSIGYSRLFLARFFYFQPAVQPWGPFKSAKNNCPTTYYQLDPKSVYLFTTFINHFIAYIFDKKNLRIGKDFEHEHNKFFVLALRHNFWPLPPLLISTFEKEKLLSIRALSLRNIICEGPSYTLSTKPNLTQASKYIFRLAFFPYH